MQHQIKDRLNDQLGFLPSSYPADIAATTTAASVDLNALDGIAVRVRNMDAANLIRVAFGETSALAITNAATGLVISASGMEILQVPNKQWFMGHRTVAGTASINYQTGF